MDFNLFKTILNMPCCISSHFNIELVMFNEKHSGNIFERYVCTTGVLYFFLSTWKNFLAYWFWLTFTHK